MPDLWYLAVGSMMDPTIIAERNIRPTESCPCIAVEFERRFWGKFGMAEVKEKKGHRFHAVLHRVTQAEMERLEQSDG